MEADVMIAANQHQHESQLLNNGGDHVHRPRIWIKKGNHTRKYSLGQVGQDSTVVGRRRRRIAGHLHLIPPFLRCMVGQFIILSTLFMRANETTTAYLSCTCMQYDPNALIILKSQGGECLNICFFIVITRRKGKYVIAASCVNLRLCTVHLTLHAHSKLNNLNHVPCDLSIRGTTTLSRRAGNAKSIVVSCFRKVFLRCSALHCFKFIVLIQLIFV